MGHVVVVGAGVGGLAAAARLAAAGHRVTVCEQAPAVGGKLGRYERDGYAFDTGPSLLTMPWVFAELFAATGAPLREVLPLEPVEPIAAYRYADGTAFASSADAEVFGKELDRALGPGAGADWTAFLARAERTWQATRGPFLTRPQVGVAGTVARAARRPGDVLALAPGRTLRGLGAGMLRDPRLRMYLDRYATYTGSDPRRAPAALMVVPWVEQAFGAWYVPGGLYRLGLALAERAATCGAEIRTGADVVEIVVAGGRATGVVLASGERLDADAVVANADAAHVYGSLVRTPTVRLPNRAPMGLHGWITPSLSGFVLLLALGPGAPRPPAHHTVLFPADYDAEFDAVFGGRVADDPTVYVSAPPDPALAPAGCQAWFVLVNAAGHGPTGAPGRLDWDAPGLAPRYAERVLDLLTSRGLPVREHLRWYEWVTPADLARRTRAPGGAIYGTSSNGALAAFRRPANRSPVPGLYLVGGSSHPGGGLPLVALSAGIVADLVGPA